jgi:hypothetical protein
MDVVREPCFFSLFRKPPDQFGLLSRYPLDYWPGLADSQWPYLIEPLYRKKVSSGKFFFSPPGFPT